MKHVLKCNKIRYLWKIEEKKKIPQKILNIFKWNKVRFYETFLKME